MTKFAQEDVQFLTHLPWTSGWILCTNLFLLRIPVMKFSAPIYTRLPMPGAPYYQLRAIIFPDRSLSWDTYRHPLVSYLDFGHGDLSTFSLFGD